MTTEAIYANGAKAGAAAERKRIDAILHHVVVRGAGRAKLARHLAFETEIPADEAIEIIARSPEAGA